MPEGQATLLWDNIDFLIDPSLQADDDEIVPHVFILSGWGAPGTALPEDTSAADGKKSWTCWCAIHRSGMNHGSGLVLMEFELEKDHRNPLYPPVSTPSAKVPETSVPAPQDNFEPNRLAPVLGSDRSTAMNPPSGTSTLPPGVPGSEKDSPSILPSGLVGDEDWTPTAHQIIESTTVRSKPLPALERLRRTTREAVSFGNPNLSETPRTRKRRRGGNASEQSCSYNSFDVMDVFAVMSQINEQLGAAPSLDGFLEIVVSVIKDLTQFHRVMVYQFDELWNGKVQAELVDWSQSHDLFRGLHFPASDIPLQVSYSSCPFSFFFFNKPWSCRHASCTR